MRITHAQLMNHVDNVLKFLLQLLMVLLNELHFLLSTILFICLSLVHKIEHLTVDSAWVLRVLILTIRHSRMHGSCS